MKQIHFILLFIGFCTFSLTGCVTAERASYGVPVPVWATGSADAVEEWQEQRGRMNYLKLPQS